MRQHLARRLSASRRRCCQWAGDGTGIDDGPWRSSSPRLGRAETAHGNALNAATGRRRRSEFQAEHGGRIGAVPAAPSTAWTGSFRHQTTRERQDGTTRAPRVQHQHRAHESWHRSGPERDSDQYLSSLERSLGVGSSRAFSGRSGSSSGMTPASARFSASSRAPSRAARVRWRERSSVLRGGQRRRQSGQTDHRMNAAHAMTKIAMGLRWSARAVQSPTDIVEIMPLDRSATERTRERAR